MTRGLILTVAVLLLLAQGAVAGALPEEKAIRIDRLIEHFLKPGAAPRADRPPGLSVAIGIDGELVAAKGFGEARQGVPASGKTVYHIGSLTKQFTAAAVLRMIGDGARAPLTRAPLTLDTPMREVFDGVERWGNRDDPPISVRSLLTMTSNLPNFTLHPPRETDPWGAVAMPKLLAALKQLPPHGWPNTFEYSNTSYFLLARMIEAVAQGSKGPQASSREYMRVNVLQPAGLTRTGFVGAYAPGSEVADGNYRRRPAFSQPHWLDGCGDMASNVEDLFLWDRALMAGGVLGRDAAGLMFSEGARVDPFTYYGMGWFIRHDGDWDSYYHSGSVPGFTSYNAIMRRTDSGRWLSVTLLTNSDGVEGLDGLADEIFFVLRSE